MEKTNEVNYLIPLKKSQVLKMQGVTRSKDPKYFDGFIPVMCFSPYTKTKEVIRYIDKNDVIRLLALSQGAKK